MHAYWRTADRRAGWGPRLTATAALAALATCLAPAAQANQGHEPEHAAPAGLVAPMGIVTFSFVLTAFLTGWLMPKKPKLIFKLHLVLAVIAILCAMFHGGLALLSH